MMVLLTVVRPLTGWGAPPPDPAQIGGRKVRWRGGGSPLGGGGRAPARCSYRDVSVLAPRSVDFLGARLLEAADDHSACVAWIDDVVDQRPAGGNVRVDLSSDRLDQLAARLLGVV